jgi:endonuclease/exonuclease/phosphatase family metal-dependent hydrolase
MSYNLKDLTADAAAAARVVRAVQPDVLCLQEVPRRLTTEFRLPAFARACGLYWGGGRLGTGGTAILSALRVRVHTASKGRLAVRFPDRTRGYAALHVSLPGGTPITVLSVHLSLRADERERHAEAILAGLGERAIVAGDLNEGSDGAAYGRFVARFVVASGEQPTFPSDHPRSVLDVIFASAGLTTVPASDLEVAALDHDDLVAGSDHRPVWVDVSTGAASGTLATDPSTGSIGASTSLGA